MHRARIRYCAGAVTAAALVALTGCTGSFADASTGSSSAARSSASDSTGAPATATATAPTTAGAAATGSAGSFCVQAGKLASRTDPNSVDTSKPDAAAAFFTQAAKDMRAITAPSAIAPDWSSVASGLADLAQAYTTADLSSAAGESQLERSITQIQTQIGPAQNQVNAYLQHTCGIGIGSAVTSSNPAPVLVPSPHAP